MKRSRRELSIDMVIPTDIFKNNQITLFPCFTSTPKTGLVFTVKYYSVLKFKLFYEIMKMHIRLLVTVNTNPRFR